MSNHLMAMNGYFLAIILKHKNTKIYILGTYSLMSKMVLIEYNFEDLKFVWIDGFVPDYEEVLKKVKDIDAGCFVRPAIDFTREELNKELLSYITYKHIPFPIPRFYKIIYINIRKFKFF